MLLANRFLLRRTPTAHPIPRVQSVVTRPPARPVSPSIGDDKRCRVGGSCWHRVPDGSIADQALCCGMVEPAKQARACGREKDFAVKTKIGAPGSREDIAAAPGALV